MTGKYRLGDPVIITPHPPATIPFEYQQDFDNWMYNHPAEITYLADLTVQLLFLCTLSCNHRHQPTWYVYHFHLAHYSPVPTTHEAW